MFRLNVQIMNCPHNVISSFPVTSFLSGPNIHLSRPFPDALNLCPLPVIGPSFATFKMTVEISFVIIFAFDVWGYKVHVALYTM
jgi:hypothetical protein